MYNVTQIVYFVAKKIERLKKIVNHDLQTGYFHISVCSILP